MNATAPPSPNPVDNSRWIRPLIKALHRHVDLLAASIPGPNTHDDHQRRTRIAAAWVYMTAVVAWAEDHHLIDVTLRTGLHGVPGRFTAGPARPVVALTQAMGNLTVHPATQWLMHPAYNTALHEGTPTDQAVQNLADWWAGDAPTLAYTTTTGPPSISGWVIGDILQAITDERRKGLALVQTPWWIADFIIDRTMLPALNEHRGDVRVPTIDPTCGTGHFLILCMDRLWEWHTTGQALPRQAVGGPAATGGRILTPERALPRVVASVDGIEIDPLTAAVARLRCTVYAAHLAHRAGMCDRQPRLDQIPRTLIPRVGVGDSLILGKAPREVYAQHHPHLAALPGASFVGSDWPWDRPGEILPGTPTGPVRPAPRRVRPAVTLHQQLDLFGAAA